MSLDAFLVDPVDRNKLAERFPPKFPELIGHHITFRFGVRPHPDIMYGSSVDVMLVGYSCNDEGLEAFTVSVNGSTHRPDGKIYHLTWSLDRSKGFKPVDSGELVRGKSQPINPPIHLTTVLQHL
jgi:hypothetical protein